MLRQYKVAAIQFSPEIGQKDNNIERLLYLVEEAAQNNAKLIVMPEMAVTGYNFFSRAEIKPFAETIPGPVTGRFHKVARKYDCYIVIDLPEIDVQTNSFFNSCALVGPEGLIGKYRKTHLCEADSIWANQGDLEFPVFDTQIGKIGCLICMDFCYFEPSRMMALKGAEVLCNPTNWDGEKCPAPQWITRAWENNLYLVSANRANIERGIQGSGGTGIIGPDAQLINYLDDQDGIVYAEIDLDQANSKELYSGMDKILSREPEYYHALTINTYLHNPLVFHRQNTEHPLPDGKESIIAIYQSEPSENIDKNLAAIRKQVERAAAMQAELLIFPELFLTGQISDPVTGFKKAEDLVHDDSDLLNTLKQLAQSNQMAIVLGLAEKEGNKLFNTIILVNEEGLKIKYRKVHLNQDDRVWAARGNNDFQWLDLDIGRVGVLFGDEGLLPEPSMCLAAWGIDILAVPACINEPYPISLGSTNITLPANAIGHDDPMHWHLFRVRAAEINSYIALANQTGKKAMGFSGIFGPNFLPRDESVALEKEELIVHKIDTSSSDLQFPDKLVRIKENVRRRLPYLYGPLTKK